MTKQDLMDIIVKVAPGSPLREGIDYILDAGIGALIVIGYDDDVEKVKDGGFCINCDYTPEKIFELSKMDGAIIINDDCSKILYANVHIQPDTSFTTTESGTRHRTAERVAKQLKREVVAISERKKNVTLYKGNLKYRLKNFDELNIEVGQVLKTLESYRYVLNRSLDNLTILELDDLVTVLDVANTLQRFEMVRRISEEITRYLLELGARGRLVNMQVSELIWDIDDEEESFLKDYLDSDTKPESVRRYLHTLSDSELLDIENVTETYLKKSLKELGVNNDENSKWQYEVKNLYKCKVKLIAENIPAMGYQTLYLQKSDYLLEPNIFEEKNNGRLRN